MAMAKAIRMTDRGLDFFLALAPDGVKAAVRLEGGLRPETLWLPWSHFMGGHPRFHAWQIAMVFRRFPRREGGGKAPLVELESVKRLVRILTRDRNQRVIETLLATANPQAFQFSEAFGRVAARVMFPLWIDLEKGGDPDLVWRHPLFIEACRLLKGFLSVEHWRMLEGDLSRIPRGFARFLLERLFARLDFDLPELIHEDEWDATLGDWRVRLMRLEIMQRGKGTAIWDHWQRLHREAPALVKRAPNNLPARGLARWGREGLHPAQSRLGWYILGAWDQSFFQAPLQPDSIHQLLERAPLPAGERRPKSFFEKRSLVDELHRYLLHGRDIWEQYGYTPARGHLRPVSGTLAQCLRDAAWNHKMMGQESVFRAAWKHWDEWVPPIPETPAPPPQPVDFAHAPRPPRPKRPRAVLPDELERLRVKDPYQLAILGQRLGHCIGSRWSARRWFFYDGGTVCAEVDSANLRLTMCLDSHNRRTDASVAFTGYVQEKLREMRQDRRQKPEQTGEPA